MKAIHQEMDDDDFNTIRHIKNNSGLTWMVFLLEAANAHETLDKYGNNPICIVNVADETIQAIEEISKGKDLQSVLDKCFKIGVISEAIEYVDSESD